MDMIYFLKQRISILHPSTYIPTSLGIYSQYLNSQLRITQLETKLEQLAPRNERRVKVGLSWKFAEIKAIKEAPIELGDPAIEEDNSDTSGDSTDKMDCIEEHAL